MKDIKIVKYIRDGIITYMFVFAWFLVGIYLSDYYPDYYLIIWTFSGIAYLLCQVYLSGRVTTLDISHKKLKLSETQQSSNQRLKLNEEKK